jgi:hypothetical protein
MVAIKFRAAEQRIPFDRFTNYNLPSRDRSRRGCVLHRSENLRFYLPIVSTDILWIVASRRHASLGGECDSAIQLTRLREGSDLTGTEKC